MIRADQLMIGDWVEVDGEPRQVCAITKKKIGYHIAPTDRLHYARLHDVNPLKIEILKQEAGFFLVNDEIRIEFSADTFGNVEYRYYDGLLLFTNLIQEKLILKASYVHVLQHLVKTLYLHPTIQSWNIN